MQTFLRNSFNNTIFQLDIIIEKLNQFKNTDPIIDYFVEIGGMPSSAQYQTANMSVDDAIMIMDDVVASQCYEAPPPTMTYQFFDVLDDSSTADLYKLEFDENRFLKLFPQFKKIENELDPIVSFINEETNTSFKINKNNKSYIIFESGDIRFSPFIFAFMKPINLSIGLKKHTFIGWRLLNTNITISIDPMYSNDPNYSWFDKENLCHCKTVVLPYGVVQQSSDSYDSLMIFNSDIFENSASSKYFSLKFIPVYVEDNFTKVYHADGTIQSIAVEMHLNAGNLGLDGNDITKIEVGDSVTDIDDGAFMNFGAQFTEVIIPNSVTSIGTYAFAYCNGLTSITIPKSVKNFGEWIFSGANNLRNIVFEGRTIEEYNSIKQNLGIEEEYLTDELTITCSDGSIKYTDN